MMKNLKTQIVVLMALFVGMTACDTHSNEPTPDLPPLTEPIKIELNSVEKEILNADKQNALKLFNEVLGSNNSDAAVAIPAKENFMISPFSLNMALTMAWNGAKGETKRAIETALGYKPEYSEALNAYYKKMRETFVKTDPRTVLSIANSLWYIQNLQPKSQFENTLKEDYNAYVKGVDFTDPTTKDLMNNWCKENTNGVIEKVIEETSGNDVMYLMNALYFKGIWANKFKSEETKQEDFTLDNGEKVKVAMMHQKEEMKYYEGEQFTAISAPYGNGAFSMAVLLPKEGKTVEQLAATLAEMGTIPYFRNAVVTLSLPKFKFKYDINLNAILRQRGMGIAFSNAADFTNALNVASHISYVKQFTGIEVNESGSEAAAATVIAFIETAPTPPKEVNFKVDRPFVFLIRENTTGSILFMGKVGNPNKE